MKLLNFCVLPYLGVVNYRLSRKFLAGFMEKCSILDLINNFSISEDSKQKIPTTKSVGSDFEVLTT